MEENKRSEDKSDVIIGIIALTIIVGMFVALMVIAGVNARYAGSIAAEGELRRGQEITFTFTPKRSQQNAAVSWYVNGKKVKQNFAEDKNQLTFTPESTGNVNVQVRIGNTYKKTRICNVLPPQLVVEAQDAEMTYGNALPELKCNCCGFAQGEDCDLDYCGECAVEQKGKLRVGNYRIDVTNQDCCYKDYEVIYQSAELTVLPRQLEIANNFSKVYDGSDKINVHEIELRGVLCGDEVKAEWDELRFEQASAGRQKVVAVNLHLTGKDAENYAIGGDFFGEILPKTLRIEGMVAKDKIYDGTAKAEIENIGKLVGVCDGDSVAIGNARVKFDSAERGERSLVVEEITLVGYDKNNYKLEKVALPKGKIIDESSLAK